MGEKQLVLIDLGGTIMNPETGIMNGVSYALEHMSLPGLAKNDLRRFIGQSLKDSFEQVAQMSEAESQHAMSLYREYFSVKGLYENYLYPNMAHILAALEATKILALTTSKPEAYGKQMVDYFNLTRYFEGFYGSPNGGSLVNKSQVIEQALNHYTGLSTSQVVLVGDQESDIGAASHNKIESMGVLYGFGTLAELTKARATVIGAEPDDILRLLS